MTQARPGRVLYGPATRTSILFVLDTSCGAAIIHAMHAPAVISILALTYWTVLVVELISDKAIYTVTTLAARHRPAAVFAGISTAFMLKTGAAVVFGRALLQLPARLTAAVSAVTLFLTAVMLWTKRAEAPAAPGDAPRGANGFVISFAALFFTEWADVGQVSTAALAAQYHMPLAIWAGGTAALMTKGLLALTVGMQLRRLVPAPVSKYAAVASCGALGMIALGTAILR